MTTGAIGGAVRSPTQWQVERPVNRADSRPGAAARGTSGSTAVLPPPRPSSAAALASGLDKLSSGSAELALLAVEKETNALDAAGARKGVRATATQIALQHRHKQEELHKAMEAAANKGWWDDFVTFCKVVAASATTLAGVFTANPLLIAGGALMAASLVAQATGHPDLAIGLGIAAALVTAGGAFMGTASTLGTAAKYVAIAATVGAGTGTFVSGQYHHDELDAEAAKLLAQSFIERSRREQRDDLERCKSVEDADERATRRTLKLVESRGQLMLAPFKA